MITLLRSMLVEAGLGAWEIEPWLTKAELRINQDHRDRIGAYFVEYVDGQPVGMASALLRDYHAFLSLKTGRYGSVADNYVLPAYRGRGIEQRLHAEAHAWIRQNGAAIVDTIPPNIARVAANSGGGKL
jgi:GNAT superfamily N-acetyltransferase